ncbi:MAG: transposase zinc-binding domain-containing protein [Gammaproteobacteria bacterium]
MRCGGCGHEKLVAFSCKKRGFCPACGAKTRSSSKRAINRCVHDRVSARRLTVSSCRI